MDVVFKVSGETLDETQMAKFKEGKLDKKLGDKDNLIRLEENANSFTAGSAGVWGLNDFKKSKTVFGHEYGHLLQWKDESQKNNAFNGEHDLIGNNQDGFRVPGIMTPYKNTYMSDMEDPKRIINMGPMAKVNENYFDKSTKHQIDPDKRKVTQRDISLILRGYKASTTQTIGNTSKPLYDANGNVKRL
jgi:hypothetical protein